MFGRRRLPGARPDAHAHAPGTLRAPEEASPSLLAAICYGPDGLEEHDSLTVEAAAQLRSRFPVCWLNLTGLADVAMLRGLGDAFGLHRLALEDAVNLPQRPKLDDYGDHQFLTARMPVLSDAKLSEQLSMFVGEDFVLTVQEVEGDVFDGIRQRIRDGRPRIRGRGAPYLTYAVLDALVDSYFPRIELIAERLDELELRVFADPKGEQVGELHDLKRDLVTLRRYLEPLRELIGGLLREDNEFANEKTKVYLRDCFDHCSQAFDLVESHRDTASSIMDLYLAMQGQRMNEVMKVLTVIATLFIPLSFIAGVYGMNFDPQASGWNMPELGWRLGYPYALGLMLLSAGGMLVYFWKKGWFR